VQFYNENATYADGPPDDDYTKPLDSLVTDRRRFQPVAPVQAAKGSLVFAPFSYARFAADGSAVEELLPDRKTPDTTDQFNLFLLKVRGVRNAGTYPNRVSLIFAEPSPSEDPTYKSQYQHPYDLLIAAAQYARDRVVQTPYGDSERDGWAKLVEKEEEKPAQPAGYPQAAAYPGHPPAGGPPGAGGRRQQFPSRVLERPGPIHFMQGVLFRHGQQFYGIPGAPDPMGVHDADPTAVVCLSGPTGRELVQELLNKVQPVTAGHAGGLGFAYPQLTGQYFLEVYDFKGGSNLEHNLRTFYAHQSGGRGAPPARATSTKVGYGVYASPTADGTPAGAKLGDWFAQVNRRRVARWDKVLKGTDLLGVAEVFANIGLPDSLLVHAWRSFPDYLPPRLRFAQVTRPATPPGAAPGPYWSPNPGTGTGGPPGAAPAAGGGFPAANGQPGPGYAAPQPAPAAQPWAGGANSAAAPGWPASQPAPAQAAQPWAAQPGPAAAAAPVGGWYPQQPAPGVGQPGFAPPPAAHLPPADGAAGVDPAAEAAAREALAKALAAAGQTPPAPPAGAGVPGMSPDTPPWAPPGA
jgi:hypothetical protein